MLITNKQKTLKNNKYQKFRQWFLEDGAIAEEGLWISRSLIPLIRLAFSLQSKLPQYTFPIWFIPAAPVTFISLWRCSNSHPRHHQHHFFRPLSDLRLGIGGGWGLNLNLHSACHICTIYMYTMHLPCPNAQRHFTVMFPEYTFVWPYLR